MSSKTWKLFRIGNRNVCTRCRGFEADVLSVGLPCHNPFGKLDNATHLYQCRESARAILSPLILSRRRGIFDIETCRNAHIPQIFVRLLPNHFSLGRAHLDKTNESKLLPTKIFGANSKCWSKSGFKFILTNTKEFVKKIFSSTALHHHRDSVHWQSFPNKPSCFQSNRLSHNFMTFVFIYLRGLRSIIPFDWINCVYVPKACK